MSEYLGEAIGTMILIIMGDGVVAGVLLKHSKAENSGWVVIVAGWGMAVALAIYAVGNISGAHINPAVTLGLAAVGKFPWGKVPGYILAQVLGAMAGATIVWIHYLPHWSRTNDADAKLAIYCTGPAVRSGLDNLVSEIIGTCVLLGGILLIGANRFTEGLNPLVIGGLVSAIGFSLGGTTGFAINPARDLGPRIAHFLLPIAGKRDSDWSYSWVPVIGPVIGGMSGALMYAAVFLGEVNVLFWIVVPISAGIILYVALTHKRV